MATIKDIAQKLGVSIGTVSKGLNGAKDISPELRRTILDTAVELGYTPKRMKSAENKRVCIFVENMEYETEEAFGYEIVTGFRIAASRRKLDVDIVKVDDKLQTSEKYETFMLENRYSGSFALGFTLFDKWIGQIERTSVPTVLLDNKIDNNPNVGYVGTDSFEGIGLAVSYLRELGHSRIAFLNGTKNSFVSEERQRAFEGSMRANGLKAEDKLMAYGYYVPDCAKSIVPGFAKNGATAIVCASDLIASGVVGELKRLGKRVPEDISVVGYDDLPIASTLTPPLTTIRQSRMNLGKSALLILDGLINGVPISKILLHAELVKRASTKALT